MIRIINISARSKREVAALDWALKMPEGISEDEFYIKYCLPLPPNFEQQKDEPKAVKKLSELRDFRIGARENYTEKQWRISPITPSIKMSWEYFERVFKKIGLFVIQFKIVNYHEKICIVFS